MEIMKNRYRRRNPKVIALIIEIALLIVGGITAMVFDSIGKPIHWIVLVVFGSILIFALILTLSLIRYDAMRDIRAEQSFNKTNLPVYTDQTTMLCHDLIDEERHDD